MDHDKAQELVENLLERLTFLGGRFELPGGVISSKERAAMALLAGVTEEIVGTDGATTTGVPQSPAIVAPRVSLSDDCLSSVRDDAALLCVDFGTAFSKAVCGEMAMTLLFLLTLAELLAAV